MPLAKRIVKNPIQKGDEIGRLNLQPEKCRSEYEVSKAACKVIPPTDAVQESIDFVIVQYEQEHERMQSVQKDLLVKINRQNERNLYLKKQLYKDQYFLRNNYIRVNTVIKNSTDRKNVAYKKLRDEKIEQEKLKNGIKDFNEQIETLNDFREQLSAALEKYSPYEKIMIDLVKRLMVYESEKDCMDRCDAILCVQVEAFNKMLETIKEIDIIRKVFVKLTKEVALKILGMQNELSELERQLLNAKTAAHDYELKLGDIKAAAVGYEMNKEHVYDSLYGLYIILCKRNKKRPKYLRNQVEEQLDYIKYEINIMKMVMKEFERRQQLNSDTIKSARETPKC